MAKTKYLILKTPGNPGKKITVPTWVPTAEEYTFELSPSKQLIYTPVVE